jgi:hypothetical protein
MAVDRKGARRSAPVAALAVLAIIAAKSFAQNPFDSIFLPTGVRQLFLDDQLLGDLYGVTRIVHQPFKPEGNLVVAADRPWEGTSIQIRSAPCWDPAEKVWKMWYHTGAGLAFARSRDGLRWEKPALGKVEHQGSRENNLVAVRGSTLEVTHVLLDPDAPPERRYKSVLGSSGRQPAVSQDGYEFTALPVPPIPSQDESHLNYDETRRQYILTVKLRGPFGRSVYLSLSRDFENWSRPVLVFHADALDQQLGEERVRKHLTDPRLQRLVVNRPDQYNTEIYNMPVFPYEGIYIGMPNYFESSGRTPPPHNNQDGINSVKLACSRDLYHWEKVGDRASFIPVSEVGGGRIDTGQVLAASRPIVMGQELWFYYSGLNVRYQPDLERTGFKGGIHLAKLRRDGFASFHAGAEEGFVETRPIRFEGGRLRVNADASRGELRAAIVDARGREVMADWTRDTSRPVLGDQLAAEVAWEKHDGIKELRGQVVRFRFYLRNADLYSFWIEP